MGWSIPIGRIAGIRLKVHLSFVVLLGWFAFDLHLAGATWRQIAHELGFVMAVFGCIVLHELGHALTARRFGIATLDITLLPIGGLARMERIPRAPQQEIAVALAGPAVNVVIAAVLITVILSMGQPLHLVWWYLLHGPFLVKLLVVNVLLAGFNLLPAFPMDGGRVLRAVLALRHSYVRATQLAARVGKGMSALLGVVAVLTGQWVLLLLAVFVYLAAGWETRAVRQLETASSPAPTA